MKTMKKVFAMLLSLVLLLGIGQTAMAATITVDGVKGQTYTAYKIFDVTKSTSYTKAADGTYYHDTDNNAYTTEQPANYEKDGDQAVMYKQTDNYAYSIAPNSEWLGVITDESSGIYTSKITGLTLTLSADGTKYVVTVGDGFNAVDFAKTLDQSKDGKTAAGTGTGDATTGQATINVTDPGYYFVDSSLGALCILHTAADTVTVNEKNALPTLAKTVQEDSTGDYAATANADFNQEVNFKLTVNMGTEFSTGLGTGNDADFVITDTLPAGMTYKTDSLAINGWTKDTDYTVAYESKDFGDVLTITLRTAKLKTLASNASFDITYVATLDQDAVVAGNGNMNTATLTYNKYTTAQAQATVYTYQIGGESEGEPIFKKVDGETQAAMPGVEFVLSKDVPTGGQTTTYYAVLDEIKTGETVTSYKLKDWTTTKANATKIVTDAKGGILVQGLDADTYILTETKTLDGYNLLTDTITVVIDNTGKVTYKLTSSTEQATEKITVENNTGTELPSTGGIGTTIFYVIGGILMVGAVILLITRKRMNGAKD